MDFENLIAILRAVNGTLNGLTVTGKENWMKIVGCMNAVDDVAKKLEEMKHDHDQDHKTE